MHLPARTSAYAPSFGKVVPYAIIVACALLGTTALGYYFGLEAATTESDKISSIINKEPLVAGVTQVDFEPFWRAWNILNDRFVGATTTSDQDKVYGAIAGLAASLGDPYTIFFPPEESKAFEEEVSGQFGGVGMELGMKDDLLTVVAPIKGNPAERAGIKAGDRVMMINGAPTLGMPVDEAVKLIRGEPGTSVTLTMLREGGEPFDLTIVRAVISVPTVEGELREDGVFVLRIHSFSGVVVNQFREALREFVVSKSSKLLIDLRGNPGGYLEAAVEMASWFLPAGDVVVSEDRGRSVEGEVYRSRGYDVFGDEVQIAILVDAGSASASEIFAGALRDHGRATLVGTRTFGKGSVQELLPLTEDTSLKVTVAQWLTPAGVNISLQGITPDIEATFTDEDAKNGYDRQLESAATFLRTGTTTPASAVVTDGQKR